MIATINNTADYLQSLSLAELRNWCEDTTPVIMTWADAAMPSDDEDALNYPEIDNLMDNMPNDELLALNTEVEPLGV